MRLWREYRRDAPFCTHSSAGSSAVIVAVVVVVLKGAVDGQDNLGTRLHDAKEIKIEIVVLSIRGETASASFPRPGTRRRRY